MYGIGGGNKKEKYEINFRIGTLTVLEILFCPCDMCENDETKWNEAAEAAKMTMKARIVFWDGILDELKSA